MASIELRTSETNQLYEWYHVPGGCPKCHTPIIAIPSVDQKVGERNLQVTTCPKCNSGIELQIAINKGGRLVPEDLALKKGKKNRPKGYQMIAKISDTLVIDPRMMSGQADA